MDISALVIDVIQRLMCPKCKTINSLVRMDFPHQDLGFKCLLCCFEIYHQQPDRVGARKTKTGGITTKHDK